jgi:toxin-antitoxin system PIN domain toxin
MPDVNVLIYAHREDEATHRAYRKWLEDVLNGPEPFGLSVLVAVAFVRIVTHAKMYPTPTPLSAALASIEAILAQPGCRVLLPGDRHLTLVTSLSRAARARGKLVADAQHAAVAIEHGCTLATRDSDFKVFAPHGLHWEHLVL